MNLKIDKMNIEKLDLASLKEKSNDALDALWNEAWLKNSINRLDRKNLEELQAAANKISGQCETAVIAADGDMAQMIRACTAAVVQGEDCADVIVFGDSFSPVEYADLMTTLETKDFVLIGAAQGRETVSERGAFVCLKQLLVSKYGPERAIDRIYAVAGKESELIAADAAENDYPLFAYPGGVPSVCGANTVAALLPMAIKGADLPSYLDGFHDMIASPAWDADAADYSAARALHKKAGGTKENLLIWQKQLEALGNWSECFSDGIEKRTLRMPRDAGADCSDAFDTLFLIEEDGEDIMMPYFQGCNQDGSLNLLLNETANKHFFENMKERTGVRVSVERLDSYTLGQLMAFVQISNRITEFLLNN